MRRTQFQRHLVFGAKIERLQMAALAQIPNMERMAVFAAEQQVRLYAMLNHVWRTPFAGNRNVVAQMPPEIVGEILRAAIHFPAAQHVEAFMIEEEQPSRTFALGSAKGANVDRVGAAMNGMRTAVAGACGEFFRFDYFDDLRI